jgi:hypothetical protein
MGIKTGGYRPIVIALGLVLFLTGCGLTQTGDTIRNVIAVKGAEVADQSLANSEWGVCTGTSMGAVMRRYGQSAERMGAYVEFCFPQQHTPFGARIEALRGAMDEVFPSPAPAEPGPAPTEVIPPKIEPFPTEE